MTSRSVHKLYSIQLGTVSIGFLWFCLPTLAFDRAEFRSERLTGESVEKRMLSEDLLFKPSTLSVSSDSIYGVLEQVGEDMPHDHIISYALYATRDGKDARLLLLVNADSSKGVRVIHDIFRIDRENFGIEVLAMKSNSNPLFELVEWNIHTGATRIISEDWRPIAELARCVYKAEEPMRFEMQESDDRHYNILIQRNGKQTSIPVLNSGFGNSTLLMFPVNQWALCGGTSNSVIVVRSDGLKRFKADENPFAINSFDLTSSETWSITTEDLLVHFQDQILGLWCAVQPVKDSSFLLVCDCKNSVSWCWVSKISGEMSEPVTFATKNPYLGRIPGNRLFRRPAASQELGFAWMNACQVDLRTGSNRPIESMLRERDYVVAVTEPLTLFVIDEKCKDLMSIRPNFPNSNVEQWPSQYFSTGRSQ